MRLLAALALLAAPQLADALAVGTARAVRRPALEHSVHRCAAPRAAVVEVSSTEEFNDALKAAGDSLVVVHSHPDGGARREGGREGGVVTGVGGG